MRHILAWDGITPLAGRCETGTDQGDEWGTAVIADSEIEGMAEDALRGARLTATEQPDPVRLARRVVGSVVQLPANGLPRAAFLARFNGKMHVCVRGEFPPRALAWSLCHEVAEALLQRRPYRGPDLEAVADRLAAALRAPRLFAERACRARGPRWSQLAIDFGSTESCAALRYGEVTSAPLALLTSGAARYRGDWFEDAPSEAELRSARPLKGLVKAALRDDPSRAVFRAGLAARGASRSASS